jgi:hypothetical protein
MAYDFQTLLSSVTDYAASGEVSGPQLLKLALLKSIAATMAPTMPTDYQSLLSNTNVPGWLSCAYPSVGQLLELSLLSIIAGGSVGGGASITTGNYAGGTPNFTPASGTGIAIDTSNNRVWWYFNGGWN